MLALRRFQPLLPWLSLLSGVAGGVLMDRSPEHAWWIVFATLAAWLALLAFVMMARVDAAALSGRRALAVHAGRFLARLLSQSATQHTLFFALPFYARAAAQWGHLGFVGAVGLGAAVTLWDPLYQRTLAQPFAGAALKALATFAGLNVVLPILGLSNGASLTVAGGITGLVTGWAVWTVARPRALVRRLAGCAVALALPLVSSVAAVRKLVPAVPLRLERAALGTRVINSELANPLSYFAAAPEQLVCYTRIWAPRGLRDDLVHVWQHDGHIVDRIRLDVRGGASNGFRTWSVKQHLGPRPAGKWRCTVQTEAGQVLGDAVAQIMDP